MGRRTDKAAERAVSEASEAARVLAERSHQAKAEKVEPSPEPSPEPKERSVDPSRVEKLLGNRPHVQAMEEIIEKRGLNKEEEPKA